MGSRRERKKREEALADLVTRSVREGERRQAERTLVTAARLVLRAEIAEATSLVLERGVQGALRALAGFGAAWASRWITALSPSIFGIMDTSPFETDRGPVNLPLGDGGEDFFREYMGRVAELVTNTSRDRIGKALEESQKLGEGIPQAVERIRQDAPETTQKRAEFISRDQLITASKAAASYKALTSGIIAEKSRHDSNDPRVRKTHEIWDGERVPVDAKYTSGEDYPGQLEFLCRCSERFHIKPELLGGAA